MGKAKRKPRPSVPRWEWLDRDGCWFCKNSRNCNQCKPNRNLLKNSVNKKIKGSHILIND